MTTTLKPAYGSLGSDISGGGLDSLANGGIMYSSAVDNTSDLFTDFLAEVYIDGTASATGFLEVRIAPCVDGTNYAAWYTCIPLGMIDFAVDLARGIYSICGHGGFFTPPPKFKIAVRNATGAALASSGSTIKVMGINLAQV